MLKHIWPWSRFADLQDELASWQQAHAHVRGLAHDFEAEAIRLRSELAAYRRFDRDGDGKPGGSRKRKGIADYNPNNPPQGASVTARVDWG